jgi:hypothetical protein
MRRLLVCLTAAFLLSIPAGSALADHHEAGEAANPCNPCAGKNPCAEKNPCAPE